MFTRKMKEEDTVALPGCYAIADATLVGTFGIQTMTFILAFGASKWVKRWLAWTKAKVKASAKGCVFHADQVCVRVVSTRTLQAAPQPFVQLLMRFSYLIMRVLVAEYSSANVVEVQCISSKKTRKQGSRVCVRSLFDVYPAMKQ